MFDWDDDGDVDSGDWALTYWLFSDNGFRSPVRIEWDLFKVILVVMLLAAGGFIWYIS
jgi:hypothetical protein